MKNITIAGNITRDAETRQAGSGTVTSFSVAVNGREKSDTLFFDCSLWGKRGESLKPYLNKGGKVTVAGEFSTREHDGKIYFKVNASDVTLMGGGQQSSGSYGGQSGGGASKGDPFNDGDSIPFAAETRI